MAFIPEQDVFTAESLDSFGRLRVAETRVQADLKQLHDNLPLFYDIETIGTGATTHSTASAETTLTTAASSDAAIMQTKQRFNYTAGKSSLLLISFRNFNVDTNVKKRVGYYNTTSTTPFDSQRDGLTLVCDSVPVAGQRIYFTIEHNGTATSYNQSTWDDALDGTGPSGVNLDLENETGNHLLWIDYEWLGVGKVRFGFVKNGIFYTAKSVDSIGSDGVYMASPNHSIRGEIRQVGAGSGGTLRMICASYVTEGEQNEIGKTLSVNNGVTPLTAATIGTKYALAGLRLQSDKLDTDILLKEIRTIARTQDDYLLEVILNPTVAGTFTYSSITNSSTQVAWGATANTVTGGTLLYSTYQGGSTGNNVGSTPAQAQIDSSIKLGATIGGVQDSYVIAITPLSIDLELLGSLNWKER